MRCFQAVSLQQFVELGAVTFGDLGRLRHAAVGKFEQARQILILELFAGVLKSVEALFAKLHRLLDHAHWNNIGGRQRDRLLGHVEQLPYVAGPRFGW